MYKMTPCQIWKGMKSNKIYYLIITMRLVNNFGLHILLEKSIDMNKINIFFNNILF